MKSIKLMLAGVSLLLLCGCGTQVQKENEATCANESKENAVIENMMSRRSIRKYKPDRKSTRLNSSHGYIPYAVFCLKKKKSPLARY